MEERKAYDPGPPERVVYPAWGRALALLLALAAIAGAKGYAESARADLQGGSMETVARVLAFGAGFLAALALPYRSSGRRLAATMILGAAVGIAFSRWTGI